VPTITAQAAAIVPTAVLPLMPLASASGPYPSSLPPPPPTAAVAAASTVTSEVRSLFDLVRRVESRVAKATVSGANDMGQLGTQHSDECWGVHARDDLGAQAKLQPVVASCGFRHAAVITRVQL